MHTDRSTKLLLGAIALGLWANVFRPALAPTPATAQEPAKPIPVNLVQFKGEKIIGGVPVEGAGGGSTAIRVEGSPAGIPVEIQGPREKHFPLQVKPVRDL